MGLVSLAVAHHRGRIPAVAPPDLAHPRTFLNAAGVTTLQTQIQTDSAFGTRWQTGITQFETGTGTSWGATPTDPYALAFAAFLCLVRRDGDLGLTWGETRASYLTKIRTAVAAAPSAWKTGDNRTGAIGLALIYDFLYGDFSASERSDFETWIVAGGSKGAWASSRSHWDGGASLEAVQKFFCTVVLPDYEENLETAYAEVSTWATDQAWFSYVTGMGYEWSDDVPRWAGICCCLLSLRNMGYSDAQTFDLFLTQLRDSAQLIRRFVIPRPSAYTTGGILHSDRIHQMGPTEGKWGGLNVGAHILWAFAILPGKVDLNGAGISDTGTLANNESDFLSFLSYEWQREVPGNSSRHLDLVKDMNGIGNYSSLPTRGGSYTFYSFPAWLILNAQVPATKAPSLAGIPKTQRYWPGTLDLTITRSGLDAPGVNTTETSVTYNHRAYWQANYETGVHQNGGFHMHRGGPLLITRGSQSHGPVSRKCTFAANGTVTFEAPTYLEMERFLLDDVAGDGVRGAGGSVATKTQILANPDFDYGSIQQWYADSQVVCVTDNLKRSYNCDEVQTGSGPAEENERKISQFLREWVHVKKYADGTDHDVVFVFDRITLLDTAFKPTFNINPGPPQITIDGTETPGTWPGSTDPALVGDIPWEASAPNYWDYANATHLDVNNVTEPTGGSAGTGQLRASWLIPAPAAAVVRKRGGTAAVALNSNGTSGQPAYFYNGAWLGADEFVASLAATNKRAYVGLYTVSVQPATVTLATRFLLVFEMLAASGTPATPTQLTCDAGSVAARCGASAVVYADAAAGHSSGNVDLPSGVALVVFKDLPVSTTMTLTPTGGLTITTAGRDTSNTGVLVVGVSGSGNLAWLEA